MNRREFEKIVKKKKKKKKKNLLKFNNFPNKSRFYANTTVE